MEIHPNYNNDHSFKITDEVLLLFNEHDSRIALNWEFVEAESDAKDALMLETATSQS